MLHYFNSTKPALWDLKEALESIRKIYPGKEYSYYLFVLEKELLDIKDNHKKKTLRDMAKQILDSWKVMKPVWSDFEEAESSDGNKGKHGETTIVHQTVKNNGNIGSIGNIENIGQVKNVSYVTQAAQKQNKRQHDQEEVIDDLEDDEEDGENIFLTKKNSIKINKKKKSFSYFTPQQQHLTSPHKPRISEDDVAILKSSHDIVLSEYHATQSTLFSKALYEKNKEEQEQNKSLKDAPGTFKFLKQALDQPLDDMPRFLWTHGYDDCTPDELLNNDMIRHVLTDYRLNCKILPFTITNERTPFSEHLIPLFKALAGISGLMHFTWCEKGLISNRLLSLCLPGTDSLRKLLDGVGMSIKDNTERVLIESSANDVVHSEEDTLKQLSSTCNCLNMDMKKYKLASFDTFLRRQVFGIHFIHDRMTLTTTRMINREKYSFTEVRSALIPTTDGNRWNWIKVFELVLKLKVDLMEQEEVTAQLQKENAGVVDVERTINDEINHT